MRSADYRRECESICKLLDELVDEAWVLNNDETPLTKEEFAEYERKFERLKHVLGVTEHRMHLAQLFESIESSEPYVLN